MRGGHANVTARTFVGAGVYRILPVTEGSHSGLVRTLGKRVCRKAPRVRIPHPPHPMQRRPGRFLRQEDRIRKPESAQADEAGSQKFSTENYL